MYSHLLIYRTQNQIEINRIPSSSIAGQVLERIYTLCEKPIYEKEIPPFCLTHNLRNIRQIIKPFLYKIKDYHSKDEVVTALNQIFYNDLKISHFFLQRGNLRNKYNMSWERKFISNQLSQSIVEENYVVLKIIDFAPNFNENVLSIALKHASNYQKGVIVDLRDNPGGHVDNLNNLFSYFFPSNTLISYGIDCRHEPYVGLLSNWIGNYSKNKMKNLINTIQSNWNLSIEPWYKHHFNESNLIQKNIAILINGGTSSCSEHFTMALKDHFPDRVKVIGEKSAGRLLVCSGVDILKLDLILRYPIQENIGIYGTRVEGVGIEPDEKSFSLDYSMNLARDWVNR